MAERQGFEEITPELLDRYLAGEGTEGENATVRRFLMARPDAARSIRELLQRLDGEAGRPAVPDARDSLAAVRDRMRHAAPPGARRRSPLFTRLPVQERTPRWMRRVRLGAAVAAVAAAVAFVADALTRPATVTLPRVEWRTYATNHGESAELRLVDGTRVRLAPASQLRIPSDYGETRREVHLEGEGYFDVVHDTQRPFAVRARNALAEDLGTAFSVRSYAEDHAVQVVVREGAVDLQGVGRLEPGDVGRLAPDGESMIRHGVDVDSMLAWLDGRLVFDNAPLADVALALERWHAIEVRLSDTTLARIPFTGALTNSSADAAVRLVAATLGLRVHRSGQLVTLTGIRGRTPTQPAR